MPHIIANNKDDLNVVSQISCLAGHFIYQTEKSTYIRLGKVPLLDWERYEYQTEKGSYIRMRKVPLLDCEKYLYQTGKGTYI